MKAKKKKRLLHNLSILSKRIKSWVKRQKYIESVYGVKLTPNYSDTTFRFYVVGTYGFFYANHIKNINKPFILIDIGANQGLYSLLAGQNKNCQKAFAFEPVKRTSEILENNVKINNLEDKISLHRYAISDQNGYIDIAMKENHSGASSIAPSNTQKNFSASQRIEIKNHKAFEELLIPADVEIHVKIDVEGHEEVVMQQLFKSSIANRIVHIFFEMDENWIDPVHMQNFLEEQGFSWEKIGIGKHYDISARRSSNANKIERPSKKAQGQ